MEEITIRFEIVRLSIKLIDHESVNVQIDKLRSLSVDEHLNEIINLLETKNFRQALYMMKGYVASLDDSFFKEVPDVPVKKKKPKAQATETQNLFDMTQPRVDKTINLDDMLRMTEESIEETEEYKQPSSPETSTRTSVRRRPSITKDLDIPELETSTEVEQESDSAEDSVEDSIVNTIEIDDSILDDSPSTIEEPKSNQETSYSSEESAETPQESESSESILEFHDTSDSTDPLFNLSKSSSTQEVVDTEESTQIVDEVADTSDYDDIFTLNSSTPDDSSSDKPIERFTMESTQEFAVESIEDTEPMGYDIADEEELASVEEPTEILTADINPPAQIELEDTDTQDIETETELEDVSDNQDSDDEELSGDMDSDSIRMVRIAKRYPAISYIDQKFRNMRHQFPQLEESEYGVSDRITSFMRQIASQGYSEQDIVDAIGYFQECKETGNSAEAAQMLLVTAASESKYAQLMLARELFKGEVLEINYPEAFTHINRLSEQDYPEAICDLAQLYEYGYGIKKDKKTALLLYEEAAEMGVARAHMHFTRLSAKKSIFGSIFKK